MSEWLLLITAGAVVFGAGTFLVLVGRVKASVEQKLKEAFADGPEASTPPGADPPDFPPPVA